MRLENSVVGSEGNRLEFVAYSCAMISTTASPASVNIYADDLVSIYGLRARILKFI